MLVTAANLQTIAPSEDRVRIHLPSSLNALIAQKSLEDRTVEVTGAKYRNHNVHLIPKACRFMDLSAVQRGKFIGIGKTIGDTGFIKCALHPAAGKVRR